jgi:hypothetical protein
MKMTPRDLLRARHAARAPQLDTLRQAALADLAPIPARELLPALFRPHRRLWLGLAAAWIVILAVHFARHPSVRPDRSISVRSTAHWSANQAQLHALLAETNPDR